MIAAARNSSSDWPLNLKIVSSSCGEPTGAGVRKRTPRTAGTIVTDVMASEDLMPGVACLPHGFGHQRPETRQHRAAGVAGASYNDLSDPAVLDVASGNAALNGLAIEVGAA